MSATNKKFHICDGGANDETLTNVDFGWSWDNRDGSGFAFRSVDFGNEGNTERGAFILWARDTSNSYSLTGKCDGTLTWPGTYNGVTLTSGKYITSDNAGGTWVQIAKDKSILNSTNSTGAYGWLNGFTKSYKVMLGAFPQSNELVYLNSFTKANIDSGTNTVNKSITWNSETGELINTGTIKINKDSSSVPNNGGLTITGGKQNFAIQVQTNGVTKGTAPSAVVYNGIEFYGNTMTKYQDRLAIIEQSTSTANLNSIQLIAYNTTSAENTGNCTIGCYVDSNGTAYTSAPTPAQTDDSTKIATTAYVKDCVPKSIGSATQPVYTNANGVVTACTNKSLATALCNSLDTGTSNPSDADYYICQYANGGTTTTSYHRRPTSALYNYIKGKTDKLYAALSGNQTIAGNKTFSGTSTFSGQVILSKNTDAAAGSANAVALVVGGAQTAAHLELDANEIIAKSSGTAMTTLYLQDGNACIYLTTSTTAPNVTNTLTLGASGKVWKQLYAGTTTISTSDERQKQQIENIPDEVLDAWEEVEFKQFKFNDAVEEKGESARIHMGLIAQRIKEVFEKHNLDPFKYGFFCYDEWDVHEDPKDENSPVIRRENGYAIRYEEALIIEAAYQRRRLDRIEEAIKLLSK